MKRSILINLFLILTIVFAASTMVDNAFENKTLEVAVTKDGQLESKTSIVKRPVTRESIAINTINRKQDYTPNHGVLSNSNDSADSEKASYIKVKKVAAKKSTTEPLKVTKSITKKLDIKTEETLELSFNEMDEQKKIIVQKLKLNKVSDFSFSLTDYSKLETQKNTDRISTIAAAPEKSPVSAINDNHNKEVISQKETTDELVFFDYSEDGKVVTKEVVAESTSSLTEAPSNESPKQFGISSNPIGLKMNTQKKETPNLQKLNLEDIRKSIQKRASKIKPPNKVAGVESDGQTKKSNQKILGYNDEGINKAVESLINDKEEPDFSCLDNKKLVSRSYKSEFSIELDSISYSKKSIEKIHNFEVRFHDDEDEILQDFGEGKIVIKKKLTTQMNIRRATFLSSSHYPTAMDLVFEGTKAALSVPVFKKDSFEYLIKETGKTGLGSHLLVELDETTEDVEIDADTKYEEKLFLNQNLKKVNRDTSDYNYILFIGVEPGNTIVNFKNTKNEISNKIVHLAEKEIFYDPNFYAEVLEDTVELYKENLLSKCKGLLNIDSDNIKPWSFEAKVNKKSINRYSLGRMIYPIGTRKYMELKHLDESIFIGRWGQGPVVVPTEDYVRHVLGNFDINGNECLVQVNLVKDIKNFSYGAQSSSGYSRTQAKFLDKDGSFYTDLSNDTKRIFVVGEEQGIINMKIDYTDGSAQYLQTYCSDSTYLVEQL